MNTCFASVDFLKESVLHQQNELEKIPWTFSLPPTYTFNIDSWWMGRVVFVCASPLCSHISSRFALNGGNSICHEESRKERDKGDVKLTNCPQTTPQALWGGGYTFVTDEDEDDSGIGNWTTQKKYLK
jgi:hypothetical protein